MIKKSSVLEIKNIFLSLPPRQRIKLLEELEDKLFSSRFREIVSVLRSKSKTSSLKRITRISKNIRKKLYDETKGGG